MPQAKIYCFEPDPRKNLGARLDEVRLFEIAVSDRTGQIDFHSSGGGAFPEGWDLSGLILPT
jgi:hypothetical protein